MVWISKSGLGILIRAPEVPFFVPPKRQKWAVESSQPREKQLWSEQCEPHAPTQMQHTNHGEIYRIFGIFCRVWRAGGQATLTTSTEAGRVKTNLEIQLGPPDDPCPDALPVHLRQRGHRAEAPRPHQHRRRHRGPGARARNNQRAAKFQALKNQTRVYLAMYQRHKL